MEGRVEAWTLTIEAWRIKMELLRVCTVGQWNSHQFDEEQDLDPDPHLSEKSDSDPHWRESGSA
jgi:hypothetical protein